MELVNGLEPHHLRHCVVQLDGIPQALTEKDRLWMPVEPLVDPTASAGTPDREVSAAHLFSASAGDNARNILRKVHDLANEATRGRLSEILTFVTENSGDITVLPEYLVPVSCINVLIGFSRRRAIVAGLGLIRNEDEAAVLLEHVDDGWTPEDVVGRNVGVLVENERVHLVTKRSPAEHESAAPGRGPRVVTVNLHGRTVRIGVAICMDYLQHEGELRELEPDVVCIPAFTGNTDAFRPEAPRDYIRLFANCASYGGSAVFAASLRGPVFTDERGTRPLGAGMEGLTMVEYDRPESRPTALRRTENRLVLRAEIVERTDDNGVSLEAIRQLSDLQEWTAVESATDLSERLTRWLGHIEGGSPLHDALEEYRRSLAQELADPELYAVLCNHLTIAAGGRTLPVRASQARFVTQRLGELIASGMEVPSLGKALDAYAEVANKVPDESETVRSKTGERWTFSISLGAYARESAASTLPRQLNFLRALSKLPAASIGVTYRLRSEPSAYGPDLLTRFDVIVDGVEGVVSADQVEGQLRSMLVESWALNSSEQVADPPENSVTIRIVPDLSGQRPAVREDWAPVMDLLRTHSIPIAVDMRVEPIDPMPLDSEPEEFDDGAWLSRMSAIPYMSVGDEADRRATAYFNVLGDLSKSEQRSLGLSIVLSSSEPIPPLLVRTIQHEIFGHLPAEIETVEPAVAHRNPAPLSPSELIGIFHPPYGHIQGRGVPMSVDQEIPFRGRSLPAGGTQVGTARIAGPRQDRLVEVPLDETARSRHIYVVGRTGTGKTNFLKEICRQDITSGRGLAVLDPHGDLVDYLMMHCQDRLDETVVLDFGLADMVPAFNPLTVDIRDARDQAHHTTDFLRVLESRYYNQFTGPVFDDMVRQALETVFEAGFPVGRSIDLVEAMYRNRTIRQMVAQVAPPNSVLRDRWNVFETLPEKEKAERITWMLSKFADLLPPDSPLRMALSTTQPSPLSIEQVVWNQGILLIKMPEASLGGDAASFLGALLVRRIQRAVFDYERGTGQHPSERPTFTLCIDEFQKFATADLESLVAEARKFGCGLILAHQNLEQLFAFSRYESARSRELLDAILGNVGSTVAFRVGPQDAEALSALLRVDSGAFDRLPKYKALCRLTVDSDDAPCFTLTIPDSDRFRGTPAAAERLRARMIDEGFWISKSDAVDELAGRLVQFEAALDHTRDAVADAEHAKATALLQRMQEHPEQMEDIILDEFEGGEMIEGLFRDLFSAMLAHHGVSSSGIRNELLAPLEEVVSLIEEPAREQWEVDYDDFVTRLISGNSAGNQIGGDLLAGVRLGWEHFALAEPSPDDLVRNSLVLVEGMLLMFAAIPIEPELRRPLAGGLLEGVDAGHLVAMLPEPRSASLQRAIEALRLSWVEAMERAPLPKGRGFRAPPDGHQSGDGSVDGSTRPGGSQGPSPPPA